MLPNWLLGKSKSKLASILGGDGTPSDYNEVKAQVTQNAEDILLLSDALDGKAALTQITNPNILHNPWFQVNQRGATSSTTNSYFVDRWATYCAATGTTTYTLNNDGTLTIDNSLGETAAYIEQRRTAKTISRVAGRTITASVMLGDGSVRSGSGAYINTADAIYYEDDDIQIQSQAQSYGKFFVFTVKAGKSITIRAFKLELGSISTLAMDTAPDMALELAKCQRYFQRINNNTSASVNITLGAVTASTATTVALSMPSQMRADPTISITDLAVQASGGSELTGTYSETKLVGNILSLLISTPSATLTIGQSIECVLKAGGHIDLSAEL